MAWTWANIDWTATATVTAAWVQALGSVAAILYAGRLAERADRRAEQRKEDEREKARSDRERAIRDCARALDRAAHAVRTLDFQTYTTRKLPDLNYRLLAASEDALRFYKSHPADVPHDLLAALSLAEQRIAASRVEAPWDQPLRIDTHHAAMLAYSRAADDIGQLIEEYQAGVLRLD